MPEQDDFGFWDNLMQTARLGADTGAMDAFLSDKMEGTPLEGEQFTSVRRLTEKDRQKCALPLPVEAGSRVSFAGNLGAVMTYENPPEPGSMGTVVTVRSAGGDITAHDGKVFVKWDDGEFRPIYAEHLRAAKGTARRGESPVKQMRVASLGDLGDFFKVASDTLVHKSTKDLWSFRQDGSDYVIERLFDNAGEPLKAG
jgi:hypothetical protein